jgi:hypothetical protein
MHNVLPDRFPGRRSRMKFKLPELTNIDPMFRINL